MKKSLLAILMALPVVASAHVSFLNDQAAHGGSFRFVLKLPHGCGEMATDKIVVHLPESLQQAKPMPKAGWNLKTTTVDLAKSYDYYGKTITKDVRTITWSNGSLPNAFYDEFVFQAKVAAEPGKLLVPVEQSCGATTLNWAEASHDDAYPAPVLNVVPAAEGHHH